jgi:hypothetical protein
VARLTGWSLFGLNQLSLLQEFRESALLRFRIVVFINQYLVAVAISAALHYALCAALSLECNRDSKLWMFSKDFTNSISIHPPMPLCRFRGNLAVQAGRSFVS